MQMKVAVAGAGIGGLALALGAARAGHEVVVCERAAAIGEVGAGIQVSPNAARILDRWGLRQQFERIAVHPSRIVIRRWSDDSELRSITLGEACAARFGHRYANVHRHDLVSLLAGAIGEQAGVTLRFGHAVAGVERGAEGRGAALLLSDGSAVEADVVVGADGIHSAVRSMLFGATPSRFSGAVAYRALVPRERVAHLPVEVTNRLGPDRHVVTYLVGPGGRWLNLVCVVPEASWDLESWTEQGSVDALRAEFEGWSSELAAVLEQVEAPVHRWALHDRPPLERWSDGAATLLGDACHPMLPFMAQGACQAIEDAAVLVACLGELPAAPAHDAVAAALRRYEGARLARTATVQRLSWHNRVLYHLPDGDEQADRDRAYRSGGDDLAAFDWLYGHDVDGDVDGDRPLS
jgi:salicylate hydroxylase